MRAVQRRELLEEIEQVYRDRYPTYLRVATAITGNVELGHDAVQEGFARAIKSRSSYKARGSVEGWLWRVVVNAARDRRSSPVEPEVEHAAEAVAGGEPGALRAAIARLPERQRLAVFLRYFADLDQASIAKVLGVRPGTVAATLHTARESLRKSLEEVESWQR